MLGKKIATNNVCGASKAPEFLSNIKNNNINNF